MKPMFEMSYRTTIDGAPRWSADTITEQVFRDKFVLVLTRLAGWLDKHGGLDGKDILDFGCGNAVTALSLALNFPRSRITGVDIISDLDNCLPWARQQLRLEALPANLALHLIRPGELPDPAARFDLIYSWSVMEHVDQALLPGVLRQLREALKPGGKLFIQIHPLYYSSAGSHMTQWVPEPWGHLLMQDSMFAERLRATCRDDDQFRRRTLQYRTLNRITVPHLFSQVRDAGLSILEQRTSRETGPIPEPLLEAYAEDALRTSGVELLAERG